MHKYLLIGMLCMSMSGNAAHRHFKIASPPQGAHVEQVAPKPLSNLHQIKLEKFISWYEGVEKQGKAIPDSLKKIYYKAKGKSLPATSKKASLKQAAVRAHDRSHASHNHKDATCCLEKKLIHCSDFGKKGVVITTPGYYCLAEDVTFKPCHDHIPAITIRSDDVILDLSTHVLSQCSESFEQFDDTSAIVVESGYNFVTIKNGRIQNFSNNGVLVLSDNLTPDDHHHIVIENIIVTDCGKITTAPDLAPFNARSGIGVYGTTDLVVRDCETSGITSYFDTQALATFFTDNILMKNCLSHSNRGEPNQGFAEGIEVNFYNNAILEDCAGNRTTAASAIGIVPIFGANLVMDNCQGHENVSNFPTIERAFAAGIAIYFTDGGIISNSQGNFNVAKSENLNLRKFCTGIQVAESNVEVSSCEASFNLATSDTGMSGGGCVGFDINSVQSCVLKNCLAEGNSNYSIDQNGGGGGVFGFDCDNASNVLLEDCVAIANNAQPGGTPTKVGGFYASIFPEGGDFANIVYKNCTSLNHSCDFAGTTVAGFLIGENPPTTIVVHPNQIIIDGCTAESNVNTADAGNGAGVSFENGTTSSSVLNSILKGNGVGILVRGANTVANLFENNEITANSLYGIQDTTGNLNSYAKNYAYNVGATANYSGLPAATPVRTWQIGFPPAAVDNNGILDPLDNISVTN